LRAAAQTLPDSIRLQETTSGFHTPAFLETGIDEQTVVAQAAENGVTLAPLGRYCLSPIPQSGLVLGFGCATPEDIVRGIDILRDLPALR
jgi:GntR family transcriptional regulator / MocR family aminotransferase